MYIYTYIHLWSFMCINCEAIHLLPTIFVLSSLWFWRISSTNHFFSFFRFLKPQSEKISQRDCAAKMFRHRFRSLQCGLHGFLRALPVFTELCTFGFGLVHGTPGKDGYLGPLVFSGDLGDMFWCTNLRDFAGFLLLEIYVYPIFDRQILGY